MKKYQTLKYRCFMEDRGKIKFNSTLDLLLSIGAATAPFSRCGWLISEILRKLQLQPDFDKKTQIIGLETCNSKASECYDYMLT